MVALGRQQPQRKPAITDVRTHESKYWKLKTCVKQILEIKNLKVLLATCAEILQHVINNLGTRNEKHAFREMKTLSANP